MVVVVIIVAVAVVAVVMLVVILVAAIFMRGQRLIWQPYSQMWVRFTEAIIMVNIIVNIITNVSMLG